MINRIWYIDYAKIMGLFLVIIAHLYTNEEIGSSKIIRTYIYGFHMPFFFAVSGMLYKQRKEGLVFAVRKNIQSLFVPYLVFNLLFVLYNTVVLDSSIYAELRRFIGAFLLGKGGPCRASWFVLCLFVAKCIYDVISYSGKKYIIFLIAIITLLPIKIPFFYLSSSLIGLIFFHLGHLSFNYVSQLNIRRLYYPILSICCFIISWYLSLYNGKVSMLKVIMGNPVIFYVNAIIGSIGLLSFSLILREHGHSFIAKISSASIGVVLLHMALVHQVKILRQSFTLSSIELFLFYSLASVIIYLICYYLYITINKYFPWAFGRRHVSIPQK